MFATANYFLVDTVACRFETIAPLSASYRQPAALQSVLAIQDAKRSTAHDTNGSLDFPGHAVRHGRVRTGSFRSAAGGIGFFGRCSAVPQTFQFRRTSGAFGRQHALHRTGGWTRDAVSAGGAHSLRT